MTHARPALAVLVAASLAIPAAATDAEKAQELFVDTHKCNTCHTVDAASIEARSEKMKSTDLSGYSSDDVASLARFLRKEAPGADGEDHKRTFKGTDEELQAIVDWLASLEAAAEPDDGR